MSFEFVCTHFCWMLPRLMEMVDPEIHNIIWCAVTTATARDMSHFGFEFKSHGRQSSHLYCNVQCILKNIVILSRSIEVFKFSSFKIHIIYVTNNLNDVIVQLTGVICYANGRSVFCVVSTSFLETHAHFSHHHCVSRVHTMISICFFRRNGRAHYMPSSALLYYFFQFFSYSVC